jgi:hypothetical protein
LFLSARHRSFFLTERTGERNAVITIMANAGHDQSGLKLEAQCRTDLADLSTRYFQILASRFIRFVGSPHKGRSGPRLAILSLLLAPALANAAELKPVTLQTWNARVKAQEKRMEERASGQAPFLWVDEDGNLAKRVWAGEILVEPVNGDSPHMVPSGLIHDWIGAVFVPKARLDDVMGVLDDYKRYTDIYRPMVAKANVIEQTNNYEKVGLLMVQKALSVTGAAETDDEVRVAKVGDDRIYSLSTSVRVREIADYGKPNQHALPEDHGPGYVWRTFNITRLEQRDDGVYVELEMLALSRGIPALLRWLIQPLAEHLPRDILQATLQDTRDAVSQVMKMTSLKTQRTALAAATR